MKRFLERYSYDCVKLLLDQVAIAIFGLVLALASGMAKNDVLQIVTSVCSVIFYLFLVYTVMWSVGARDRISIDLGKIRKSYLTPVKMWLLANSINLLLAILVMLGMLFSDIKAFGSIGGVSSVIALLIEGMYSGLMTLDFIGGVPLNSLWPTYFVITLYLTDGSATNPYIINDANDFWDIDLNEESLDAHYRLMTNVDITDTSTALHTISNFSGTITSHSVNGVDYIYSLYGFTLTNDVRNLFSNFSGTIENVNFVVNYAYSVSTTDSLRLGVFDRNIGTLTNVSVNISGNTSLNNSQDVVFGGLVAENEGYIEYNSDTIIGSTGNLTMSGTAVVSFGGLVGENMGVIVGCYDADDTDDSQDQTTVDLSVYILDGGAMASINIVANLNTSSQIGGLVGYNGLNGSIANAYVTGSISSNTNNVGGVIGRNESVPSNVTINLNASGAYIDSVDIIDSEYTLTNVVSSVVLTGNNYIGGIVGYDIGGSYYNCDYQILPNSSYGISGNIYIGGIAGWSDRGLFSYCSVYSYRWDYTHLDTTFTLGADIVGTNSVAGIVGSSSAQTNDNGYGVVIMNSSTNAYLSGNKNVSSGQIGNVGGMINSDNSPNDPSTSVVFNAYFIGKIDGRVTYTSNLEQSVNIGIGMGSIITNNVYSIILTDSDTMIGFYQNNIYMNNSGKKNKYNQKRLRQDK